MIKIVLALLIGINISLPAFEGLAQETYTGTIVHNPGGMSSDIYLRKQKDRKDPREQMMDMYRQSLDASDNARAREEMLEIEREKLRLMREELELKKRDMELRSRTTPTDATRETSSYDRKAVSPPVSVPTSADNVTTSVQEVRAPFTVYFKNGKNMSCDLAWRKAGTIYLVAHGKKFAVGYSEEEIDIARSFK